MKVRIALSADTILYLPIYCLEQVHRPPGLEICLDQQPAGNQLGDLGAYSRVQRGEADLCVCDPMVVLQEYTQHRSTTGVLVASLVTSTGLWALRTPSFPLKWDGDASLFDELAQNPGVKVRSILTYNKASTAGQVVRFLLGWKNDLAASGVDIQKSCAFGEELRYLNSPLPSPDDGVRPDLIITCDLVGALAAKTHAAQLAPGITNGIGIAIDFPKQPEFRNLLFTGLVVHRGFLRNNREAVVKIVSALQEILGSFHRNPRLRWSMAEMIAHKNHLFPGLRALFPGLTDSENFAHQSAFCMQAVEQLDHLLASTVRLSKDQWDRQAKIWKMEPSEEKKDPYSYLNCSDRSIGAAAYPPRLLRQARKFRRFLIPVFLPVALIVETFHGLAGFYHLYDIKPGRLFWILLFGIWGGVVCLLVGLGLSKKHAEI